MNKWNQRKGNNNEEQNVCGRMRSVCLSFYPITAKREAMSWEGSDCSTTGSTNHNKRTHLNSSNLIYLETRARSSSLCKEKKKKLLSLEPLSCSKSLHFSSASLRSCRAAHHAFFSSLTKQNVKVISHWGNTNRICKPVLSCYLMFEAYIFTILWFNFDSTIDFLCFCKGHLVDCCKGKVCCLS